MSVGHCGLICFANLSRGRIVLGSLARLATESGPGNKEIFENCIRYVDFVAKSHVPFRPPSHPLRSLNSLKASGGLSLSFSRTIRFCERTQSCMCWLRSFLFKLCSTLLAGLSICFSDGCRASSLMLFLQTPASTVRRPTAQLQRYMPSRVPQRKRCLRRAEAPLGRGSVQVRQAVGQGAQEAGAPGRVAEDHEGRRQANPHMLPGGP